jgi:UDP-glucuronate 4-epimerase
VFPQKVLVTGAAGFIGSHLCEALLQRGSEVVGLDSFESSYGRSVKEQNLRGIAATAEALGAGFRLVEGDIRDRELLARLCARERFGALAHLAARAGVRASLAEPLEYAEVNVEGTLVLLEEARRSGVERIVVASSSSVYGATPAESFRENLPPAPVSPYAASKLAAEVYCQTYHALYGLQVTCLRLFTVYGPRQRPDLAIRTFVGKLLAGEPLPVFGDGTASRDYTYVADTVAGLMAALERPAGGAVINLGSGNPVPLLDLIAALEEVTGRRAALDWLPAQAGDVPRTCADLTKAKRVLGWEPRVTLREGLSRYVEWWQTRRG